MKWNEITIRQFQHLAEIEKQGGDDFDVKIAKIAYLEGKTVEQMDELSIGEVNALFRKFAGLFEDVKTDKKMKHWTKDGIRYKLIADIRDINAGQYNELIHFSKSGDIVGTLHYLMATLVQPMQFKWWRWVPVKKQHAKVADAMLEAPFHLCLKSVVFFCKVYTTSLASLKPFLVQELMREGMKEDEASEAVEALQKIMDGILMPNK